MSPKDLEKVNVAEVVNSWRDLNTPRSFLSLAVLHDILKPGSLVRTPAFVVLSFYKSNFQISYWLSSRVDVKNRRLPPTAVKPVMVSLATKISWRRR